MKIVKDNINIDKLQDKVLKYHFTRRISYFFLFSELKMMANNDEIFYSDDDLSDSDIYQVPFTN